MQGRNQQLYIKGEDTSYAEQNSTKGSPTISTSSF